MAQADSVNPRFTVGWLDYAQARGFVTDPARVAHPQDKPRVERMVQYVRGQLLRRGGLRRSGRRPGPRRGVVRREGRAAHPRHHVRPPGGGVRRAEAALLLPAPAAPYEVPIYAEVKVHRDYHVQVAKALYSIPEHLSGTDDFGPRRR